MFSRIKERVFSRQFLNLLMIKMLIPAMATGGMSVEFGAHNPLYMIINSGTPVETFVVEMVNTDINSSEANGITVALGYQPNMADESIAIISAENTGLSIESYLAYFKEQSYYGNPLEPEVKLPDLTFT